MLSKRLGWLIMESPAAVLFAAFFMSGSAPHGLPSFVFLGMWEAHYLHRAFIYPFGIADGRKKIPALVVLMGFVFNAGNAYFNGRYLFTLSGGYPQTWLVDPRFITGLGMFIIGYIINRWADGVLFHLRKSGESGYQIPIGGLFDRVSCPNYFGEIVLSGWMGDRHLVAAWPFLCYLDHCQPGAASARSPRLVPDELSGVPKRTQSLDPWSMVNEPETNLRNRQPRGQSQWPAFTGQSLTEARQHDAKED
jgi:hypothetical protein